VSGLSLRLARLLERGFPLSGGFEVPPGAICALIGPSGGGKSTVLGVIAGFVQAEAEVRIDGREVSALPPAERPVTMLFQDHNLFPHLDLAGNVALGVAPVARPGREARARAVAALAEVGLAGFEARRPDALSGGQRSRAALARALIRRRPALLLDEPFAALGPGMRAEMLGLLRRVAAETGAATVLVTHDPAEARAADLVAVVGEGEVTSARPPEAAFADPPPALARWLGD